MGDFIGARRMLMVGLRAMLVLVPGQSPGRIGNESLVGQPLDARRERLRLAVLASGVLSCRTENTVDAGRSRREDDRLSPTPAAFRTTTDLPAVCEW
jgi:hypothetical protein